MELKTLLTTLFIVVEIVVFFIIIGWINWLMKKYKSSLTSEWLILVALIMAILFIWIMLSFIFYMFF